MGAAVPIVGAVTSVASGIAGISAKNKAAAAERERISAQSRIDATRSYSAEMTLSQQQQSAAAQYQLGLIARMNQFYQADSAVKAQQAAASLRRQQEVAAIETGQLQAMSQLATQQQAVERQASQATINRDTQESQANAKAGAKTSQATQILQQVAASLTEQERRQMANDLMRQMSSGSVKKDGQIRDKAVAMLAAGLNTDREVIEAELQRMNETDLADIQAQLGLSDADLTSQGIQGTLEALGISSNAARNNAFANERNTLNASEYARQLSGMNAQIDLAGGLQAYRDQDYSLGVQRSVNRETGQHVADTSAAAMRNVRGAGFTDYLAAGMNTYQSVAPLFGGSGRTRSNAPAQSSNRFIDPSLGFTGPSTQIPVPYPVNSTFSGYVPGDNA
jgi:hypothetical protein